MGKTIGEELLIPTKLYAKLLAHLIERFDIRGAANITGGGWIENMPRLLGGREDVHLSVNAEAAPLPAVFTLLQKWGQVSSRDMYNTFNMGVGLALAVPSGQADSVMREIEAAGEKAYVIGHVAEGPCPDSIEIKYE
jgi:phosphoribosylformylglycinamidine cyclo-ligase